MISLINAGPGTGKSWTLINSYLTLSNKIIGRIDPTPEQESIFNFIKQEFPKDSSVAYFAHNNSTKENLIRKLPKGTEVKTFHGAGQSVLTRRFRYQKLVYDRTDQIICELTGVLPRDMDQEAKAHWNSIKRLVNYFKLEMMTPSEENFNYVTYKYPDLSASLFPEDWMLRCTKVMDKAAIPNKTIEFVDMLWLGAKFAKQRFDLGFVDESQDISQASYTLVTRLCKHVVFCGDRNQAINAFAGASEEMYDKIEDKSDAVHPLKVTLRNPKFICDMANHIRPNGVIHGPNKHEGTHETIPYSSLPEKLECCTSDNTLIISRTNAAVISCAINLHQRGIKVRIVDRDLADEVKYFLNSFFTKDLSKLKQKLNAYEDKASRSPNALYVQMIRDRCSYTRQLIDASPNFNALLELIKATFEKHPDGFKLSSIHKSKGLEAENIFILNPPIELEVCMNHPIAREQEINLSFVAVTRSARNLFWVK